MDGHSSAKEQFSIVDNVKNTGNYAPPPAQSLAAQILAKIAAKKNKENK